MMLTPSAGGAPQTAFGGGSPLRRRKLSRRAAKERYRRARATAGWLFSLKVDAPAPRAARGSAAPVRGGHRGELEGVGGMTPPALDWKDRDACKAWLADVGAHIHDAIGIAEDRTRPRAKCRLGRTEARHLEARQLFGCGVEPAVASGRRAPRRGGLAAVEAVGSSAERGGARRGGHRPPARGGARRQGGGHPPPAPRR
jgi:hypothetical protein